MPTSHTVYQLVRCGPRDVSKELDIVGSLVDEWNSTHVGDNYNFLRHSHWSTDAAPDMSDRPQGIINRQIIDSADIVVAIFWTRFGTPTGRADSGTEEEVLRAIEKKKRVMLYFSDLEGPQIVSDETQYQKVRDFRERMSSRGLYWTFSSRAQFQELFRKHLAKVMAEITTPKPPKAKRSRVAKAPSGQVLPARGASSPVVVAGDNSGIAGNQVHIGTLNFRTQKSSGKRAVTPGLIEAEPDMRTYATYLVKRYIEWRQKGQKVDGRKFSPASAHGILAEGFGSPTSVLLIPASRFFEWVSQAQRKIDRTVFGQGNTRKGYPNYQSWEQHLAQRGK